MNTPQHLADQELTTQDIASVTGLSATLASSIYTVIKEDILTGKLAPGSKLRLQTLNKIYKVGNSPLREALNRLSANGMVSQEENKGFRVASATIEELKDIVHTRCLLEEVALRQSIIRNDEDYYERIVLLSYRLSRLARPQNNQAGDAEHDDLHLEFHQAILSGCGSSLLVGYCLSLYEQTQRYRNLTIDQKCRNDHQEKDHQEICDAILNRDADKAIMLLRSHYQITQENIIQSDKLT